MYKSMYFIKYLGWLYNDCVELAKNFTLPPGRGSVSHKIFPQNHGLRVAWFQSWNPSSLSDRAVILEDDLEVSPQWFSWLRRSWITYGHRTDLAGIALSRQYMVVKVKNETMLGFRPRHPQLYLSAFKIQNKLTDRSGFNLVRRYINRRAWLIVCTLFK